MKNYLVITLGTREIQLPANKIEEHNFEVLEVKGEKFSKFFVQKTNDPSIRIEVRQPSKEFPDFFTISPRTTAKIINDNYPLFRPVIDYPIVRPAIEYLKQKNVSLDVIMLVYTDQEEAFENGKVKLQNMENDSIYYADIISKLIKEDSFFVNTEIDQFGITDSVTDLGYQYDDFKRINEYLLYSKEVKQVFLYPQGGIDQINQALTLRLIEIFKVKVKQLQKAEGADFKELDFPSKFLASLNKQKILEYLDKYNFSLITNDLTSSNEILTKAIYANTRLTLRHNELNEKFTEEEKCKDLYLAAKIILLKQNNSLEFLWRLFTINENLFKIEIEKLIGNSRNFYNSGLGKNDLNLRWERVLNDLDEELIPYLRKKKIVLNNPNRWAYKSMYIHLMRKGVISQTLVEKRKCVGDKIELLANIRNNTQHNLGSTTKDELDLVLIENNYSLTKLLTDLDQIFNIQGFGIYDVIRKEIEALL